MMFGRFTQIDVKILENKSKQLSLHRIFILSKRKINY
jgi:hypothetical protein